MSHTNLQGRRILTAAQVRELLKHYVDQLPDDRTAMLGHIWHLLVPVTIGTISPRFLPDGTVTFLVPERGIPEGVLPEPVTDLDPRD